MITLNVPVSSGKRIDEKIIPMINIVFLLLMFFIIAGSLSEMSHEEVVPPRSSSDTPPASTDIDWILARDGTIILRHKQLSLQQLAILVADEGGKLPSYVTLRADANTPSGKLLPLMDLMRDYGVKRISLVTIRDANGG